MAMAENKDFVLAVQISAQYRGATAISIPLPSAATDNCIDDENTIPSRFVLPPGRRPLSLPNTADVLRVSPEEVPVIDLAAASSYGSTRSIFLRQLYCACANWGIFHVYNHGVPEDLLSDLGLHVQKFLALPVALRGAQKLGNHAQGYGSGFVRLSTGTTEWRDFLRVYTYPLHRRHYEAWPPSPELRKVIERYSDEVRKLQINVLRLMSESLGLSAHRLEEMMGEMQQTILVNHYPPCPRPDLAIGIDTHTDVGAVSCLWQPDDVVGLQVLREGEWHPVSSARGALTIIVADQVQIASNGIFKSPLHRGVLNKDKNRVSILSFYQLNPEQLVSPLEDLISDSSPPMYQPTRFKDHEQAAKGPLSANAS